MTKYVVKPLRDFTFSCDRITPTLSTPPKKKKKKTKSLYIYILHRWTLLLSHHGVKQCFHTMDVAVNNWATAASNPAGPISAKSANLMKNATIFVAKRTKNWAWEAREVPCFLFFPPLRLVFFFNSMTETNSHSKQKVKKKKTT